VNVEPLNPGDKIFFMTGSFDFDILYVIMDMNSTFSGKNE
jgi:hypothetical protein